MQRTRREFLADVGRGMLIAGVGPALATDLGFGSVHAADTSEALTFGKLEPLVCLLQETAADKVLPILVERLRGGTKLEELTAAAALANARTFGGEDYVGFHTLMALSPAYHMAREMPEDRRALPVLKVLYRNSNRIREKGGRANEVLRPVEPAAGPADAEKLREAVRRRDLATAERLYAALARNSADDALNELLPTVHDATEVHRVVLVSRAWDLLDLVGKERAHTLLRQSVHFCVRSENDRYVQYFGPVRTLLPKLLDQYQLTGRPPGKRAADDAWVEKMGQLLFQSTPESAADAAAAALADGFAPEAIAEAVSLAANQLVLRDNGRSKAEAQPNKPAGSIHGDGIGVHACDSANAWRNIARVSNARNAAASTILSAYQVAKDRTTRGGDFLNWQPYPRPEHAEAVARAGDAAALLREAEAAIKEKDQGRASAAVDRYGRLGGSPRAVFDLLLTYAVSEDGALHAEKYYRTVAEEFAVTRPTFRWRQLVALARVTASAYGQPAPGYQEACGLLKV